MGDKSSFGSYGVSSSTILAAFNHRFLKVCVGGRKLKVSSAKKKRDAETMEDELCGGA